MAAFSSFWGLRAGSAAFLATLGLAIVSAATGGPASSAANIPHFIVLAMMVLAFSGLHSILSASRARAAELDRDRALLHAVLSLAPISMTAVDASGRFTLREGQGLDVIGESAGAYLGRSAAEVFGSLYPAEPRIVEYLARALAGEDVSGDVEVKGRVEEAHFRPILSKRGDITGAIALGIDVTERRRSALALERRALHDPLTELPNRALFFDRLGNELARARREKTTFAVVVADLDGFKHLNDTQGHAAGDAALRTVAAQLGAATRESDTVSRLGGDEFAIILRSVDAAVAGEVVGRIVASVLGAVDLGISVGVAMYPADGTDADGLVARADASMYETKRARGGPARQGRTAGQRSEHRAPTDSR